MGLPIPKLADKTFSAIFLEARALIGRDSSAWTDHNLHDPGITFTDLFAWLAEMQLYYLDRITTAHKIKFLKMLGTAPRGPRPARVLATFQKVEREQALPAGMEIIARKGKEELCFTLDKEIRLVPVSLGKIQTVRGVEIFDQTKANHQEDISFFAFGEDPGVGAALHLDLDVHVATLAGEMTLTFLLDDSELPRSGAQAREAVDITPSVELNWEYLLAGEPWQRLTVTADGTRGFTQSGSVTIVGPAMPAGQSLTIRCQLASGQYEIAPRLNTILLNTATLLQVQEISTRSPGDGRPGQQRRFDAKGIIPESLKVEVGTPDSPHLGWQQVSTFDQSAPDDRHYLFDPVAGELLFGNGLNGRVPSPAEMIKISWQRTLGARGNIPPGWQFDLAGLKAINLVAGTGGQEAESVDAALARARSDLSLPHRAVTATDYEEIALMTPGLRVARAKAIVNYHPDYPCVKNFPNVVTVVVVPVSQPRKKAPTPGPGFLDTISRHLDRHRLITTRVKVVGPQYIKISVSVVIHLKAGCSQRKVLQSVQLALNAFLDPLQGGPDGGGWPFGRAVFPAEIYQVVDGVPGVDYLTGLAVKADGGQASPSGVIVIPRHALVYAGQHQIRLGTEVQP